MGSLPPVVNGYEVGLCRIKKVFTYFDRMERHTGSVEIIAPVNDALFIPLAPPGDEIPVDEIEIVQVKTGEIITLHEGVWHFACGPLHAPPLDYFVFLKGDTPQHDLEMREIGVRVLIDTQPTRD
jgi:hypothetical protein